MMHYFSLSVISKISLSAERSEIGVGSSKNLRKKYMDQDSGSEKKRKGQ